MENGNSETRPKILLADDSVTIRKVVELTFADEGIDVVSVADGDAAMAKFVEYSPDLVIADVNMPGMSGYQICEMIKQDESTSDIPVILLVGSFEPFDAGEAVRVGSNYYFIKPFQSIRDLINKVKEYLAVGSFDRSTPETNDTEDLYQKSIIESADAEPGSEFDAMVIDEPLANVVDEYRDTAGETEEPILEPRYEAEPAAEIELGDAGMDDEIIETVHVSEPSSDTSGYSADPFAAPATITAEQEQEYNASEHVESEKTASGPDEMNAGEDEVQAAKPLRLAIVEDESAPENETPEPERSAEPTDSQEVTQSADMASIELIELIVKKVIERMSDTAVREAAQEAVPRIAEKLIREALEAEKK